MKTTTMRTTKRTTKAQPVSVVATAVPVDEVAVEEVDYLTLYHLKVEHLRVALDDCERLLQQNQTSIKEMENRFEEFTAQQENINRLISEGLAVQCKNNRSHTPLLILTVGLMIAMVLLTPYLKSLWYSHPEETMMVVQQEKQVIPVQVEVAQEDVQEIFVAHALPEPEPIVAPPAPVPLEPRIIALQAPNLAESDKEKRRKLIRICRITEDRIRQGGMTVDAAKEKLRLDIIEIHDDRWEETVEALNLYWATAEDVAILSSQLIDTVNAFSK